MSKELEIIELIRKAIEDSDVGEPTPMMMDPNTFNRCVGIMVDTEDGTRLGYTIVLNDVNQNKDE